MSKPTIAEIHDLVPPWSVIEQVTVTHVDSNRRFNAYFDGTWYKSTDGVPVHPKADLNRIARLTLPLDSWEPKPNDPLPVNGWKVVQQIDGERRWEIHDANGKLASFCSYDTRREAYIWAWTKSTLVTDDCQIIKVNQINLAGTQEITPRNRAEKAEKERDAYAKAKAENDERFQTEVEKWKTLHANAEAAIKKWKAMYAKLWELYVKANFALDGWKQADTCDPMIKGECIREARERTDAHDAKRKEEDLEVK